MSEASSGLWEHLRSCKRLQRTPSIKTFAQAERFLGSRDSVKIGNNTILEKFVYNDVQISICHFRTSIVTYYKNGEIRLDNGGYFTATTKKRLNLYSPFVVAAKDGRWFIHTDDGVFLFARGIRFTETGLCTESDKYKVGVARK